MGFTQFPSCMLDALNEWYTEGAPAADSFEKLPRETFLLSLCDESARIEAAIAAAIPQLFCRIAEHAPVGIPGLDGADENGDQEGDAPTAVPSFALQVSGWLH